MVIENILAKFDSKKNSSLVFYVNGKKIVDDCVDPEWTLLYYLRTKLRLCGTKLGCGEGGCGACTVMISRFDRTKNKINHLAVNACLTPVCSLHGAAVITVEGIGSTKTRLHPVQERIAKSHGSQCGFCTPGIVMSMYTLLRTNQKPSMEDMDVAFQGNLCRCTGYRPIIEGYKSFTCDQGENCCQFRKNPCQNTTENGGAGLVRVEEFTPFDPSQEPIFPPELKISDQFDRENLVFRGREVSWFRPTTLDEVLELKNLYPEAKLLVGNTEIGVEVKFKNMLYPVLIHSAHIEELTNIELKNDSIIIGASVTLLNLEETLLDTVKNLPESKTRILRAMLSMLNLFGSKQIRSVGSIGGNIVTGSPISDLIPLLIAAKAVLNIQSKKRGTRTVLLDPSFYSSYRKTVLEPEEILVSINLSFVEENRHFFAYKQSRRRDDDIAIVNFAINVEIEPKTLTIQDAVLVFGGMSFKTVQAGKTEQKLIGQLWNENILEDIYSTLLLDLPLSPDAPGGMIEYRQTLCLSLFFKAFLAISSELGISLNPRDTSILKNSQVSEYKSAQYFTFSVDTKTNDSVHRPLVHVSAFKQATGEAVYCDDSPFVEGELHLAFVLSTRAHARIVKVNPQEALAMDGVVDFVSSDDINRENNKIGPMLKDEKIFYDEIVTSQGQIIGAIVAEDQIVAKKAAKKVQVCYEDIDPVIVTIEDAIARQSYFDYHRGRTIGRDDVDKVLESAPYVLEGECKTGAQEQFYLEPIAAIVIPKKEDSELEVICSTQNPSQVQSFISSALNIDQNKIVVKVRRIGGGFGGKDYKPSLVAVPVAIAARKLNRPIRCSLDRDEDMVMTGGRHPFLSKYRVGFDKDGKILGVDIEMYLNGGYALDASPAVMQKAMTHVDGAYNIPNLRVKGYVCKTNTPSNTAFRGFGAPQGHFVIENVLEDVADYLGLDKSKIIERNLYKSGDFTFFNQPIGDCTLNQCYQQCLIASKYHQKLETVKNFNKQNRYKKRGLSLVCTKFGIAFTNLDSNQGGALVLVYTDGSILLTHAGVEMGQGLLTKMIQVASTALGVPMEKIHTTEVSTDKIPNMSPTAASASSDIYGAAILEACEKINKRLEPYKQTNPNGTFEEWIKAAYADRVNLMASGFHKIPNIGFDWSTGSGSLFHYFTYGAACCEVEIDTLTGDHRVLKVDIVMDVGRSLNPAIDVGQIEGAFMQGYGLFVLEEMVASPSGVIYTKGPGNYKIPGFGDIPREFNVTLLAGVSNPRAVFSSKAIGEPPLFLGSSAYFAIKNAIKAAREENGVDGKFKMASPATCEKIRLACYDSLVDKLKKPAKDGKFVPWGHRYIRGRYAIRSL